MRAESDPGGARRALSVARRAPGRAVQGLFNVLMNALDFVMAPIQRAIGVKRMPWVFLLPNLAIFGIFVLFPMLLNFYYAFTGGTNLFPQNRPFVGTSNFQRIFNCGNFLQPSTCQEDTFWRAVHNAFIFVPAQLIALVLFALITAMVLNRTFRFRGFFRSVFFYPVLLSPVVVALIWKWILQREGLLNAFIQMLGGHKVLFLLNAHWAMFWVVFTTTWATMGFYTLILLAGLQSIPAELYEAGAIDGAGAWQSFRYVTLPLLMPTLLVVLVLALIRAVQLFDEVFAFTGGGPGTATTFIVQYIYNTAFATQIRRFGLAAAASVLLGVVLLMLTLVQLWAGRRSDAT